MLALVVFLGVFGLSLDTFTGRWFLSPSKTLPLFVIYVILNGVCIVLYAVLQVILIFATLENLWPIGI